MRVLIQRVKYGSVIINEKVVGEINKGIVILVGFHKDDTEKELNYLYNKIVNLRIFEDENKKLNKSLIEVNGEVLLVPQFTLYANCKRGRRPDFIEAASAEIGKILFDKFLDLFKKDINIKCETGIFGAEMLVKIFNDGPVTIILDSKELCH